MVLLNPGDFNHMDIFFLDPSEVPLPPDEVKIRQFRAEPRPDGVRIRIYLEVDPFQKKPSAEITIRDPQGKEAASVSIIESVTRRMELTMHLRTQPQAGVYTAHAVLVYSEVMPDAEDQSPLQNVTQFDQAETEFSLPG